MKHNIRILDIAQKAGVSIGTVDRVLHNRGEVSAETKERILKIIKEFDYRPNLLASSLASKKTITFASLIPWSPDRDSFWAKPLEGINQSVNQLRQYGVRLEHFFFKMDRPESFTKEAAKILELAPEGVLLAPWVKREALQFTKELDQKAIPYIFIDSTLKEANPVSFVVQDSFRSGYLGAKLLDYGIEPSSNVLLLHITRDLDNANHLMQREMGFLEYFSTASRRGHQVFKLAVPPETIEIRQKLNSLISEENPIHGIFVTNSRVNLITDFFSKQTFRPKIIGYDLIKKNIDLLNEDKIDFLINQKPEAQGYIATNLLFDQIVKKEKVAKVNYTSIDIITRENIEYYSSL